MWSTARLVARTDLMIEWRSRVIVWQVLPFAIIALVLTGLAVGPSATSTRAAAPGLFYLVILFVALTLIARARAAEAPEGTRDSIRMLGLDPAGVFLGKVVALMAQLVVAAILVLAGTVLALHAPLTGVLRATPSVLLALGALSAGGTLFGVLVGAVHEHATLLPIVALPPFAAVLIAGEKAMAAATGTQTPWRWVTLLALVCAAYVAVGVVLYGVAEDT